MRFPTATAASVAVLLIVGACSSGNSPAPSPFSGSTDAGEPAGTAPTTADLDARTFIVTEAGGHDVVQGSTISLRFEDGRLGILAGCNQMSGDYEIIDGVLVVGQVITTEMGCEPDLMDQDAWISGFVDGAGLDLDGDTLTLVNGDVMLRAMDESAAAPDLPLAGTTWTVDGLVTADAVSSMPAGVSASMVFADGQVAVHAGCNRGSGQATVTDGTITFGPIMTTRMACQPVAMQVEKHVLAVLRGDVGYAIDAGTLTIGGNGVGLVAKGS